MRQKTADASLSIKIVTFAVILMTLGFFIGSIYRQELLIAGALLFVISALCYLFAPVSYELSNNTLIVFSRIGKKEFSPVTNCSTITEKIPFTIRLWGNGGMFAGTGIFWNRSYGIFRAYVTRSKQSDYVLVSTTIQRILITPEDPKSFIESWKAQEK